MNEPSSYGNIHRKAQKLCLSQNIYSNLLISMQKVSHDKEPHLNLLWFMVIAC